MRLGAVLLQRERVLELEPALVARARQLVGVLRQVRFQVRLRHEAAATEGAVVAALALVPLHVDLPALLAAERLRARLAHVLVTLDVRRRRRERRGQGTAAAAATTATTAYPHRAETAIAAINIEI